MTKLKKKNSSFLYCNILCDHSLESSLRDDSNEWSHNMVCVRHEKVYFENSLLSAALVMYCYYFAKYRKPICSVEWAGSFFYYLYRPFRFTTLPALLENILYFRMCALSYLDIVPLQFLIFEIFVSLSRDLVWSSTNALSEFNLKNKLYINLFGFPKSRIGTRKKQKLRT